MWSQDHQTNTWSPHDYWLYSSLHCWLSHFRCFPTTPPPFFWELLQFSVWDRVRNRIYHYIHCLTSRVGATVIGSLTTCWSSHSSHPLGIYLAEKLRNLGNTLPLRFSKVPTTELFWDILGFPVTCELSSGQSSFITYKRYYIILWFSFNHLLLWKPQPSSIGSII